MFPRGLQQDCGNELITPKPLYSSARSKLNNGARRSREDVKEVIKD